MGNPTTYRGYTMAWRGKQLTSASNGTNSLTFEYNEDGLRQKKTVNNVVTDYFYNGSVLIGMQRGQSKFLFSYDAGGNVISVRYITANDTNEYYYLRNAQGDIVKLIDANGVSVVEYTYDTWGKKVTTTGSLAGTLGLFQPFRYRGYVYDWETGLYYLQSRYYDPTTGRFISADVLLSTGQGVLGHNCYAYCLDNPVGMRDDGGNRPAKGVNNPDGDPDDDGFGVVFYDVPLFNQGTTPLCWAYCQIMVYAYRNNKGLSQEEADAIAKIMDAVVQYNKPQDQKGNHGSYPHDIIGGIDVKEITCMELYELLKDHGPLYAFYKSESGHCVVITGVDVEKNIVYTNNPWNYSGWQSLEDFANGVLSHDGSTDPIGKLNRITWSR